MPRRPSSNIIPDFDPDLASPHRSYRIEAHNKKLTADFGSEAPIRFQAGYANFEALCPEEGCACQDPKAVRADTTNPSGPNGEYKTYRYHDHPDVDPEVMQERVDLLQFFQNAHKTPVPVQAWDEDKRTMVISGTRLEPTYVITPRESAEPPRSGRARQAATAAA